MSAFLPCPFCGGAGKHCFGMGEHWIRCLECRAAASSSPSESGAITLWNNRHAAEREYNAPRLTISQEEREALLAGLPRAPQPEHMTRKGEILITQEEAEAGCRVTGEKLIAIMLKRRLITKEQAEERRRAIRQHEKTESLRSLSAGAPRNLLDFYHKHNKPNVNNEDGK